MKKFFIMSAALAVLLSACHVKDSVQEEAIPELTLLKIKMEK